MPAPPRGEFNNITLTRNPDHFFTQREVVPLRKMTTPLTIAALADPSGFDPVARVVWSKL